MSPTPRRAKKVEQGSLKKRDRAMAIVGLIVVASMFLTLVITPGTVQERTPALPTEAAPSVQEMLTAIAQQATVQALQTAFAATAATATPTPTATPGAGATPSLAATP